MFIYVAMQWREGVQAHAHLCSFLLFYNLAKWWRKNEWKTRNTKQLNNWTVKQKQLKIKKNEKNKQKRQRKSERNNGKRVYCTRMNIQMIIFFLLALEDGVWGSFDGRKTRPKRLWKSSAVRTVQSYRLTSQRIPTTSSTHVQKSHFAKCEHNDKFHWCKWVSEYVCCLFILEAKLHDLSILWMSFVVVAWFSI